VCADVCGLAGGWFSTCERSTINSWCEIMKMKYNHAYQFKITLGGSKPPIWRQIQDHKRSSA
jgi:hypothetical protein